MNRFELGIVDGWVIPWKMLKGYHVLLGWNLKRIREIFGVLIYDHQSAICVSTPIESMIPEQETSLRVLVSSWSNLVAFVEYAWVGGWWWEGILWKMPKGYHVLLGWNLKRIKETFGVQIYDSRLADCVSTPIEYMIPEQEISLRVLVSSRSNLVAFGEYAWVGDR